MVIDDWTNFNFIPSGYEKEIPCVYMLVKCNHDGFVNNVIELVYIGQTKNLKKRIAQHEDNQQSNIWLGNNIITFEEELFDGIFYLSVPFGIDARLFIESELINRYFPKMNVSSFYFTEEDRNMMKNYVEGLI